MCAIFGIIGKSDARLLKEMSKCQFYRGPDSQTIYTNKKFNISLGMNRLAVIDKKNGNQPMLSHDKRHMLVFNGAIYNFVELKKYLEKKINFKTNSDTEVLVNSFNHWGKKCFNYFDGMWAVGIYDFKEKKFILSRDYVGQKPLFYYYSNKNLIFSSQLNGIFKYKNNFKISENNYDEYLRLNHFPAPITLYNEIYQVEPGQSIEFKNNKLFKKKYWSIEKGGNYNLFFPKTKKQNVKNVFEKIIKNYLTADKDVGLCLSAGMDSKLIKSIMLGHKKKISSFTIGFKEKSFDESYLIKSDKQNRNIKKIIKDKDILKTFKKIKKNIYFPFGDSSIIPTYELFNLVKKKTNVSISGDGGDEVFFGYEAFRGYYFSLLIKKILPKFIIKILKFPFKNIEFDDEYMNFKKKIKFFFKFIDKEPYLLNSLWISNFSDSDSKKYFKKFKNTNKFKSLKSIIKLYDKNKDKMKFAQYYFIKFYLPTILMKVDFSSMINSVENRSPYLSKNFLNYSVDLDSKKNFRLFTNRNLMKQIFYEYIAKKPEIKKHGFAFNKSKILKNKKIILNYINPNFILNINYFKEKYNEYLEGNNEYEQYLWNEIILNFSRQNLES